MKHASLTPALLLFATLTAGCAGTGTERAQDEAPVAAQAPEPKEEKKAPDADELEKLQHAIEVSRAKLQIAQMKIEGQRVQREQALAHAAEEVAMADAKLQNFLVKLPGRRSRAELDLRGAKDSATEAAEELRQIELMYEEQDLADRTAEFVVNRGRRRAERAAARIAIQETEVSALLEIELPLEQKKLELAVRSAEEKLGKTQHEAKLEAARAELELREAEVAVKRAERALEKAREGGDE